MIIHVYYVELKLPITCYFLKMKKMIKKKGYFKYNFMYFKNLHNFVHRTWIK